MESSVPIIEHLWPKDGSLTVTAPSVVETEMVGFVVDLAPEWRPQPLDGLPFFFQWGKRQFCSLGPGSEVFLAPLSREYALPSREKMLPQVDFAIVSVGSETPLGC